MNIRLLRIYSVPIRINSPELHVPGTCLFILWVARGDHVPFHVWNSVGWHVATTCHPLRLFVFLCISGGTYIYVPIYVHTIKIHDLLNKVISLIVLDVSLAQFYFLFDGPGMSFVEGIVCPQASEGAFLFSQSMISCREANRKLSYLNLTAKTCCSFKAKNNSNLKNS